MNKTEIEEVEGAYLIELDEFADKRGRFVELFSTTRYNSPSPIAQINLSQSWKGVVRGLHVAPFAKLCTCVRGQLFDVVADVRPGSATYGRWFGAWLTEYNGFQLYIPAGCAHGFYSAEDNTLLCYLQDGLYDPKSEYEIHWQDPTLGIKWPQSDEYILSKKDAQAGNLGIV